MRRNWEEKPPCASAMCDMMLLWAGFNSFLCKTGMRAVHCLPVLSYFLRKAATRRDEIRHYGTAHRLVLFHLSDAE